MISIAKFEQKLTESCSVENLDKRLSHFERRKKRSREMATWMYFNVPGQKKLARNLDNCASYLVFNHYYRINQIRLSKLYTCKKHLLCPFCAAQRGIKHALKNYQRADKLIKEKGYIPAIMTHTIKNGHDLNERVNHLRNNFKTLLDRRRKRLNGSHHSPTSFENIAGGVYALETTYSPDKGWHPHIHTFVLLKDYIDQRHLSQEWKDITGDSFIVGITEIKGGSETELMDGIMEVFKYQLKMSDMPLEVNYDAYRIMSNKRLQSSFGEMWGVKVDDKLTDELIQNEPFEELIYQYFKETGYTLNNLKKRA